MSFITHQPIKLQFPFNNFFGKFQRGDTRLYTTSFQSQVNINYMYALAGTGGTASKAVMVFRFSDNDRAIEILRKNEIKLLDAKDFGIIESTK